jgi:site-specific recombinase XerC
LRSRIPTFREHARFSAKASEYLLHFATNAGAAPRTVEAYEKTFGQFVAFLLTRQILDDIREFTPERCSAFRDYLIAAGLETVTVRTRFSALSSFAKWAMRQKGEKGQGGRPLLAANPTLGLEWPKRTGPRHDVLSHEELAAVRVVDAPDHEALARDLLMETGLRVSQLTSADIDDLKQDADGNTVLTVRLNGRTKRVPVSDDLSERLRHWVASRSSEDEAEPLLLNQSGRRYSRQTLSEMLARLGRRAGIGRIAVRPERLRATLGQKVTKPQTVTLPGSVVYRCRLFMAETG